jgi:hypothetical protein
MLLRFEINRPYINKMPGEPSLDHPIDKRQKKHCDRPIALLPIQIPASEGAGPGHVLGLDAASSASPPNEVV